MCWYRASLMLSLTAEQDIPVFKVVNYSDDVIKGWYYPKVYQLGELNKGITILPRYSDNHAMIIEEGYHSYSMDCRAVVRYRFINVIFCLDKVHTYPREYNMIPKIVKGYIPKGACYYLNPNGEYVSNKIVLTQLD